MKQFLLLALAAMTTLSASAFNVEKTSLPSTLSTVKVSQAKRSANTPAITLTKAQREHLSATFANPAVQQTAANLRAQRAPKQVAEFNQNSLYGQYIEVAYDEYYDYMSCGVGIELAKYDFVDQETGQTAELVELKNLLNGVLYGVNIGSVLGEVMPLNGEDGSVYNCVVVPTGQVWGSHPQVGDLYLAGGSQDENDPDSFGLDEYLIFIIDEEGWVSLTNDLWIMLIQDEEGTWVVATGPSFELAKANGIESGIETHIENRGWADWAQYEHPVYVELFDDVALVYGFGSNDLYGVLQVEINAEPTTVFDLFTINECKIPNRQIFKVEAGQTEDIEFAFHCFVNDDISNDPNDVMPCFMQNNRIFLGVVADAEGNIEFADYALCSDYDPAKGAYFAGQGYGTDIDFSDNALGIESVGVKASSKEIFNLMGQKVTKGGAGIYVRNGQKFIVK